MLRAGEKLLPSVLIQVSCVHPQTLVGFGLLGLPRPQQLRCTVVRAGFELPIARGSGALTSDQIS